MKLFLGLVTHGGSRFNTDGFAVSQLETIAEALTARGHRVECLVSDRDDFTPTRYDLRTASRVRSAWSQAGLEHRWNAHVSGFPVGPSSRAAVLSRGQWVLSGIRRTLSAVEIPGVPRGVSRAGLTRLINIDLSHIRIWRSAVDFDADITLVLEDDARLEGSDGQRSIGEILECLPSEGEVITVLSSSIAASSLGVDRLLETAHPLSVDSPHIRVLETALTNTVCANAYSRELLRGLIARITPDSLIPVHPIDWRVNQYLLGNPDVQGLWVSPTPFVQMSMRQGPLMN